MCGVCFVNGCSVRSTGSEFKQSMPLVLGPSGKYLCKCIDVCCEQVKELTGLSLFTKGCFE